MEKKNVNIKNEKNILRSSFLEKRNALSSKDIQNKSQKIFQKICSSEAYQRATKIFSYVNMGQEIETKDFIEGALRDGKQVAVPKVKTGIRAMDFIGVTSLENLTVSKFGVPEPGYDVKKIVACDGHTLIIVPGLVFDLDGYRIGYGGGYYDSYLTKHSFLKTIGVAYDFQIVEKINHGYFDIAVNEIISEEREIVV